MRIGMPPLAPFKTAFSCVFSRNRPTRDKTQRADLPEPLVFDDLPWVLLCYRCMTLVPRYIGTREYRTLSVWPSSSSLCGLPGSRRASASPARISSRASTAHVARALTHGAACPSLSQNRNGSASRLASASRGGGALRPRRSSGSGPRAFRSC